MSESSSPTASSPTRTQSQEEEPSSTTTTATATTTTSSVKGGFIVRLDVENFKSYKGKQTIGPFHNFTCIIGPNGAGKSNLMDAISFVVGLRAAFLRSSNLKQLIYNADGQSETMRRTASVELVFRTSDDEMIHFKRTIAHDGSSVYYINDRAVQATKYDKRLSKLGILSKARNFLVFQGDVESIAAKSPDDLTKLFEQISGSDEFKVEYDQLREENDKMNNTVITNLQKKKHSFAESKKYKVQQKEASKYDEKLAEHVSLQTDYILWKLYHIEKKITEEGKEQKEIEKQITELTNKQKTTQTQLQKKRREYAKLRKDNITLTRDVKNFQKLKSDRTVSREKIKVQISHAESEIKKIEDQMAELSTSNDKVSQEIATLQDELIQAEKEEKETEERLTRERSRRGELDLTGDQLEEYLKLRSQAGVETVTLNQRLTTIQAERSSLLEQLRSLQQKREELTNRKNQLRESIESSLNPRLKRLQETINTSQRILDEKVAQRNREISNQEARKKEKDENQKKLEEVSEKLRDARVDKKASEREQKFADALDSMKRLFSGVHGRLRDLCRISREKYHTAVFVAMGNRNANAIVVDTEKVALDCIDYLKEQRVSVATFIPLDTIKAKKINEKLRSQLDKEEKLVLDVLTYERPFEKAFRYAIGNTVMCDTLENAMNLCFEKNLGEKLKAVTLDGTVISKSGMITGGQADVVAQSQKPQFREKDIDKLKKTRDEILTRLQELARDDIAGEETLQKIARDIVSLEERTKFASGDLEFSKKKKESIEADIKQITEQLNDDVPQITNLQNSINTLNEEAAEIEKKIKEIEDRIFGDFSRKLGISNIREYESERLKLDQEATAEQAKYQLIKSRISQKLEYARKRQVSASGVGVGSLQQSLDDQKKKLSALRNKLEKIENDLAGMVQQEEELKNRQTNMKKQISEKETETNELQNIEHSLTNDINRLEKQKTTKENTMDRYRNERKELFMKCRMEEIELPTTEEDAQPAKKKRRTSSTTARTATSRRRRTTRTRSQQESDDDMSDDEEVLTQSEPFSVSQSEEESSGSSREREETIRLDFSELDKKILNITSEEYEQIDEEFRDDLARLQMEIDSLAPSAVTSGRADVVQRRYDENFEEYKQSKEKQRDIQKRFKAVQQKRFDTFMKAFEPISQAIDQIYKDLTRSDKFPLGGTAYLGVQDNDEPYLKGIKFNAMPPTKRYRDMDQLSGGEKTVAALALLFAIHTFRPSPFFILDEVDAALDNVNVQKIANYVLNKKDDCQFIVISLKESLFNLSDALCGVYRDHATKSSGVLTLDLTEYGSTDTAPTSVSKALATPAPDRRSHDESFEQETPAEETTGDDDGDDVMD